MATSKTPFRITNIEVSADGDITLTWKSTPGNAYSIEGDTDLIHNTNYEI